MRKHTLKVFSLLAAMLGAWPVHATGEGPTPYPDAKDTAAWPGEGPIRVFKWMTDNRNHFWTQREKDQGAIVFVGDSLTAGWKPAAMKEALPDRKLANRGIGGDVSRGALFRFKEDVLDLNPNVVVLCIGTNDLSAHAKPEGIANNIAKILDMAHAHAAQLPILLCTIPPRDSEKAPLKPGALAESNDRIRKLAEGREHVTLLDLYAALANEDGSPKADCFAEDKLHLAAKGYETWGKLLQPTLDSAAKN